MRTGTEITRPFPTPFSARPRSHLAGSLVYLAGMLVTTASAQTLQLTIQSRAEQTSLLELYTSEGCSSCPPAEKWLTDLKASPGLWNQFVPVAFHVDYWDYLGWRDPWASKVFSDRQRVCAQRWRGNSVYTPAFVLNGQEWHSWSRGGNGPPVSGVKAGVLRASSTDLEHWRVSFSPARQVAGDYQAHAALLVNGLTSDVKAGENRGLRLNHDFVVTALTNGPLTKRGATSEGELELKTADKKERNRLALAVWVTPPGSFEPLQAVGAWLPSR